MQTSEIGTFPTTAREGWPKMMAEGGWAGFYKGLQPLWFRQVPYTMVKFGAFENTVKFVYNNILTAPKSSYSKATQLSVTFASGYWAGIFCAIVSHPADTIVSYMNKAKGSSVGDAARTLGFSVTIINNFKNYGLMLIFV